MKPPPLPDRSRTGLVVIDVQEKLFPHLAGRERFLVHLEFLIRTARLVEIPVVVTEQYPKGLGPTSSKVKDWLGDAPRVEKMTFSACGEPTFEGMLAQEGILDPILCGIEAHICVCQTVLDLVAAGRTVYLAADAVASRHPHDRDAGIELARRAGAQVTTSEAIAFALFDRAGSPEFKAMQQLIIAKDEVLRTLADPC